MTLEKNEELSSLTPDYIGPSWLLGPVIFLFFSRTLTYFLKCPNKFPRFKKEERKEERKGGTCTYFLSLNIIPSFVVSLIGMKPHWQLPGLCRTSKRMLDKEQHPQWNQEGRIQISSISQMRV